MKKVLSLVTLLFITTVLAAQTGVTQFLGIPVDGSKSEMIRKLKAKGFTSTSYDSDILEGEFNGRDVTISIVTNKNKVYRIMVMDKRPSDEGQIKIRYNALYRQFLDNDKYVRAIDSDSLLSDEEDIEYEITINNKQYAATFCQKPDKAEIESQQENSLMRHMEKTMSDPEAEDDLKKGAELLAGILYNRNKVWFTIAYFKGKYYIAIYYDNERNAAHGEDL